MAKVTIEIKGDKQIQTLTVDTGPAEKGIEGIVTPVKNFLSKTFKVETFPKREN